MNMPSFKNIVLGLLIVIFNGVASQTWDFPDPIKFDKTCGHENLVGQWSVGGSLTLTPQTLTQFHPKVVIKTAYEEICTIDLTLCGSHLSSKTTVDSCDCVNKVGNVHNIYVRRRPRLTQSGLMIQGLLPSRNTCLPTPALVDIGVLPIVYATPIATYQVDDDDVIPLTSVHNVTVVKNQFTRLQFCVMNLVPDSALMIEVGGQVTKSFGLCVDVIKRFDLMTSAVNQVVMSYEELSACERRNTHSLYITEDKNADVIVTETKAMTSGFERYIPVDTCAKQNGSSPRELVTLSDGRQIACDKETDGGNWVIVQRRTSAQVDFYRGWDDYVAGFGDRGGNFWMGLEPIHRLCNYETQCELRLDMKYNGRNYHATYANFRLSGLPENYKLHVTGYSGDAGDVFTANGNGQAFSTKDKDNDVHSGSCSQMYKGGWWYSACHKSNLNGLWGNTEYAKGLTWFPVTGYYNSVIISEIKVRAIE